MSRRKPWLRSMVGNYQRYTWKQVLATCEKHGIEVEAGRMVYTDTGRKCHGGRIYVSGANYHDGQEYTFRKNDEKLVWNRCKTGNPSYMPLRYLMQDLNRYLDDTVEYHMFSVSSGYRPEVTS